eukprot:jgi/Botrbrau1/7915/Bobra.9_2s0083.1
MNDFEDWDLSVLDAIEAAALEDRTKRSGTSFSNNATSGSVRLDASGHQHMLRPPPHSSILPVPSSSANFNTSMAPQHNRSKEGSLYTGNETLHGKEGFWTRRTEPLREPLASHDPLYKSSSTGNSQSTSFCHPQPLQPSAPTLQDRQSGSSRGAKQQQPPRKPIENPGDFDWSAFDFGIPDRLEPMPVREDPQTDVPNEHAHQSFSRQPHLAQRPLRDPTVPSRPSPCRAEPWAKQAHDPLGQDQGPGPPERQAVLPVHLSFPSSSVPLPAQTPHPRGSSTGFLPPQQPAFTDRGSTGQGRASGGQAGTEGPQGFVPSGHNSGDMHVVRPWQTTAPPIAGRSADMQAVQPSTITGGYRSATAGGNASEGMVTFQHSGPCGAHSSAGGNAAGDTLPRQQGAVPSDDFDTLQPGATRPRDLWGDHQALPDQAMGPVPPGISPEGEPVDAESAWARYHGPLPRASACGRGVPDPAKCGKCGEKCGARGAGGRGFDG